MRVVRVTDGWVAGVVMWRSRRHCRRRRAWRGGWWLCPSAAQSTHRNGWLCGERTPQHLLHVSALRTSGTPAKRAEQGGPAPQRRAGALGLRAAPRANSASERARARRRPAWTCTWRAA